MQPSKASQRVKMSWKLMMYLNMNQDMQVYHWACHIPVSWHMKKMMIAAQNERMKREGAQRASSTLVKGRCSEKKAKPSKESNNQIQEKGMSKAFKAAIDVN